MYSFSEIYGLIVFLGWLVGPQLLGGLIYKAAKRFDEGLAHLSGVLIPPIVYFLVTRWLFLLGMQSMSTETSRVCGLYSIFIVFILFGGSAAHLAISWVGHWILHSKHKIDQQSQLQHS